MVQYLHTFLEVGWFRQGTHCCFLNVLIYYMSSLFALGEIVDLVPGLAFVCT